MSGRLSGFAGFAALGGGQGAVWERDVPHQLLVNDDARLGPEQAAPRLVNAGRRTPTIWQTCVMRAVGVRESDSSQHRNAHVYASLGRSPGGGQGRVTVLRT